MVLEEFSLMGEDANVYKLVGPILAKQDLSEAKQNVGKRVEFIENEITRLEKLENDFNEKVEDRKRNITKLNEEYRRLIGTMQQMAQ